jgi:hypothetical protein
MPGCKQVFYFDVNEFPFFVSKREQQLKSICYNKQLKTFMGLEYNNDKNDVTRVSLDRSWMNNNYSEQFIQKIMEHPTGGFVNIEVGAVNDCNFVLDPNNDNPKIQYQQMTQSSCVFKSISSALHFLGFSDEAQYIDICCDKFFLDSNVYTKHCHRIMQYVYMDIIRGNRNVFHTFNKIYNCVKLTKQHDILHECVEEKEIRWIVMQQKDGSTNHCIVIVSGFIFDSNQSVAIKLSKENLEMFYEYVSVERGYHFILRKK